LAGAVAEWPAWPDWAETGAAAAPTINRTGATNASAQKAKGFTLPPPAA
jgi:hypothetical protein